MPHANGMDDHQPLLNGKGPHMPTTQRRRHDAEESDVIEINPKRIRWLWGIAVAVCMTGAAVVAAVRAWDSKVDRDDIQKIFQAENPRIKQAEDRVISELREDIDRLERVQIEQQILLIDAIDMITRKLDASNPKSRSVPQPRSLRRAKEKAKRDNIRNELYGED